MKNRSALLEEALEICLAAIQTGAGLEACLALFPALEADLRPLLETARRAQSLRAREIPSEAREASQARTLTRASHLRASRAAPKTRRSFFPRFALATLIVILVCAASLTGLASASAQALPGDRLYPAKRAFETARLELAPNPESHDLLANSYRQRRIEEVQRLLSMGRVAPVVFEGVVTELEAVRWVVGGVPVEIGAATQIVGEIQLGMFVEVHGETRPTGEASAKAVYLRAYAFIGPVESLTPTRWQVGGVEIHVLPTTQIAPGIQLGDTVMVLAEFDNQGTISARAILATTPAGPGEPAPPQVTALPEDSPTPEKTAAPAITQTPAPAASPTPLPPTAPPAAAAPSITAELTITGVVQAIDGNSITVDGTPIAIDGNTEIRDNLKVGDRAEIDTYVMSDGSLLAKRIRLDSSGSGSGAGDDETPEPPESPEPGETDEDEDEDEDDHTPEPTETEEH